MSSMSLRKRNLALVRKEKKHIHGCFYCMQHILNWFDVSLQSSVFPTTIPIAELRGIRVKGEWRRSNSGNKLGNKLAQTNYGKEPYRLVLRAPASVMSGTLITLIMSISHSSSSMFTLSNEYMVWPVVNRHELVNLRMSFIMTWFVWWEMTRTTVKCIQSLSA